MRIRVSDILELVGAGASFDEILEDYPYLEREDILAAMQYAALQTDPLRVRAASASSEIWNRGRRESEAT